MSHNTTTINGIEPLASANIPLTLSSVVAPSGDGVLGFDGANYTSISTPTPLTWSRKASIFTLATATPISSSANYYNTSTKWAWVWRSASSVELLGSGAALRVSTSPPSPLANTSWGMAITLPIGSHVVKWAINTDERLGTGEASLRLFLSSNTTGTAGQYVGNTARVFAGQRHGGHLIAAFTTTATNYLFARVTSTNGNYGIVEITDVQKPNFIDIRSYT